MMGIAATDGRLIRPADDPTTAKISFDWCQVQERGDGPLGGNPRTRAGGSSSGNWN